MSTRFLASPHATGAPSGHRTAVASQQPHIQCQSSTVPLPSGIGRGNLHDTDAAEPHVTASERPSLRRFIRRFVHVPWDVDDIVQEAYLRLLEHRPRGREPDAVPRYLFAIARNLVVDRRRRSLREARRSASLFELAAQLDNTAPTPDDLAFVDQASDCLRVALSELPERARHAFLLHRFEGLGYPAIAARLGVTTRTIERDIAAALGHLRRALFASEGP